MLKAIKHFNQLKMLFDSISDFVFLIAVNKDGSFSFINANKAAVQGYNLSNDFIGKKIDDVIPKESADLLTQKYTEAIESKRKINYQSTIYIYSNVIKSRKEKRYFESEITPVYEKETCKHIIVITRDITDRKQKEKQLKQEKLRLEMLFNNVTDAVFTFDHEGNYLSINPGFTKLFGWTEADLKTDPYISILPEDYKQELHHILDQLKQGTSIENFSTSRITNQGKLIDVLSSYAPVMEDNLLVGGIAMYKDITNITNMAEQLRSSERQYRLIFDHLSDLIRIVDPIGTTIYASPSHKEILGISPEFYLNKSFYSFVDSDDMSKVKEFIATIVNTKEETAVEFRRFHKDGRGIWMEARGTPVLDLEGNVDRIILVSRNIDDLKQREESYKHLAYHDELTNLPNRRRFEEQFDLAIYNSKRTKQMLALLTLDCDNFKQVNDRYGHEIGDKVIQTFARRIQLRLRQNTDLVSRVGGDEFQVLLTGMSSKDDGIAIAKKIMKSINKPFKIDKLRLVLTTSIGISYYNGDVKDKQDLLKESDLALYTAKSNGKNRYHIYSRNYIAKYSNWERVKKLFNK